MRRREFIAGFGSAVAWPPVAGAQQLGVPVIGWLSTRNSKTDASVLPAFHRGLNGQGYLEGRNVTIEYRWSDTQGDRLPALAADLVSRKVAVIAAVGLAASVVPVVQSITSAIPIVSAAVSPDIAFNRPDSQVTGVWGFFDELEGKRVGLLHDLLPRATTIAVLISPGFSKGEREAQEAARLLGLQIKIFVVGTDRELDAALKTLPQLRLDALMVATSPLSFTRAEKIVAVAEQLAVPAIYYRREFVVAGGLMSYGTNADENFRVMGEYTGRILKGEKPGDLPIQQPTKFEFVINLKVAKALSLEVPPTLLALADEVFD